MRITIEVTQEDIDHGRPRDCRHCPIARATNRVLAEGFQASVTEIFGKLLIRPVDSMSGDILRESRVWYPQPNPYRPCDWMHEFDAGHPVAPTAFDIDLPDEYLRGNGMTS